MSLQAKQWITPVAIAAGLVLVLVLSNRDVKSPEELELIDSQDKYSQALMTAHEMTKPIFDKTDEGDEPTEQEKDTLYKSAKIIDNANRLLPDRTIPFLGAGKAYMLAGDLETAELRFRQAIHNAAFDKTPGSRETAFEAHYRLSQVRFKLRDYEGAFEEADKAVKGEPNGPEYLLARASALIQLKKYDEADRDIHAAVKLEPSNQEAIGLHALLALEDPKKFGKGAKH
ncbi:MAG: hypothetical protein ACAH95_06445 [Fimbriimonas sp.]